jgi:DmsE family decaheme c-type cytochrome
MNRKFCLGGRAAALFLMLSYFTAAPAAGIDWEALNPEVKGATYVKSSTECVECHQDYMQAFTRNKHGMALGATECESCHGPVSKHLEAPRRKPPLLVALTDASGLTPQQKASVCLQCHEGGIQTNWKFSTHSSSDVACTNCHHLGSVEDEVLVRTSQSDVCFTCHQDKRSQSMRFSRHPVREAKVICSDCHNPHGSPGRSQLVKNTVNDVCYQCHAEKRGPFLWEHQPVREECTVCHNPHGSSQPRMLKVRTPWLCQQCHMEAFHPSTLYSGTGIPANAGAAQQLLGRSCTNCHSQIHGSNHPSGARFTR